MLNYYHIPPANGGKAAHAVIFLHGLGDSGQGGLLAVGEMWGAELPNTEFICPDAPFAFDRAPPEMTNGGRQWFTLQEFSQAEMAAGAQTARPYLEEFIDHILATRGLVPGKLALAGFSQGTIMALYVAPRRAPALAGIIGYSGILIGGETLPEEKKSAPPVLLVHGTADEVVPYIFMNATEQGLKSAGIPVTTITCQDVGHTIDNRGLAAGLKFLKTILV